MDFDEKKIKKSCVFYVSDYHLEMKIIPYITQKIKENKKIEIFTEINLEKTICNLLNKLNIKNKEEILKLNWKKYKEKNLNKKFEIYNKNTVFIINGTEKFVEKVNNSIEEKEINNCEIINCYNFEEIKEKMDFVVNKHDFALNIIK